MGSATNIWVFFLFLTLLGCSKDETTKPATVEFDFAMNTETEPGRFLTFDQGQVEFDLFHFDGDRIDGGDFVFDTDFPTPVNAVLHDGTISEPISFDIPQGTYDVINVGIENSSQADDPGITYSGVYNDTQGDDIVVILS